METCKLIGAHLLPDITRIVDGYLRPNTSNDRDIAISGYAELYAMICHWKEGLRGLGQGGHIELLGLATELGAHHWDHGLFGACESGHVELARAMLDRGANPAHGLVCATRAGHYNVVNLLVQKTDRRHGEAIYSAAKDGRLDIVNLIAAQDQVGTYNGALHGACWGGHLDIIRRLIDLGADDFNWGLCGACGGGNMAAVNAMIELGANDWNTGLYEACEGKHPAAMMVMIERGATQCGLFCNMSIAEHVAAIKQMSGAAI